MSKFQPALFGGLFIGVMSGLPLISAGNICCCLWVVIGGVLAQHFLQKGQAMPVEMSQAVLTGLIAGAVGAVIAAILNMALLPITGPLTQRLISQWVSQMPNVPPEVQDRLQNIQTSGSAAIAQQIIGLAFSVPMYGIFAMLGALLGRAMFKPKNPPVVQS